MFIIHWNLDFFFFFIEKLQFSIQLICWNTSASNFSKELNEKHTNKAFNKMKGYAEKSMILLQHVNKMGIKIWYSICSQRVEFQLGDQISTEINNSDIEVKSWFLNIFSWSFLTTIYRKIFHWKNNNICLGLKIYWY